MKAERPVIMSPIAYSDAAARSFSCADQRTRLRGGSAHLYTTGGSRDDISATPILACGSAESFAD
jgi:hypothetical protein